MLIDAHSHIFPAPLAEKAAEAIGNFYEMGMHSSGSIEKLLRSGGEAGVDKYLVCSAATTPNQVVSINNFIAESYALYRDKFIPYGTLHPDMEEPEDEIERMLSLGLKGVKLHSDFQNFAVDDEKCDRLYSGCDAAGLSILFHAGDKRYRRSGPGQIAAVAKKFPSLRIQASHLGGYSEWDQAETAYRGLENISFDCSSSLALLSPVRATELIRALGVDRVMWGSDFPMWSHKDELERFLTLGLSESEKQAILYKNAERILCV